MRQPLTIAAVQPFTVPHDTPRNACVHADAVLAANSRVVVFPEMSLTGYEMDAVRVSPDSTDLAVIRDACRTSGSVALVGGAVQDGGAAYIAVFFIDGHNASVVYRKMNICGAELTCFSPGPAPAVVVVDGWRLGLAVCKDTGVPSHADATAALGMDVYVAGVLDAPDALDVQDERARATAARHGVWVVNASYAGSAGAGYDVAAGHSRIWNPGGVVVAEANGEPGEFALATLS